MKLSARGEYACLALIDLAQHHGSGFTKIEDVAQRKRIPKKYLEQILLILKRARYLKSRKGPEGGYRLAKPPAKISVAEMVRLMGEATRAVRPTVRAVRQSGARPGIPEPEVRGS